MNKRGQVYIIAALILSVVIFLLISQTNFVQRILIEDDFEQISKNFEIESAKLMNNLLAEGELDPADVKRKFEKFTDEFSNYAWVENPNFEFVYIFEYGAIKLVGYYIKEDISVGYTPVGRTVNPTTTHTVAGLGLSATGHGKGQVTDEIDVTSPITIGDFVYTLDIEPGSPQIIIISREEKGEQTKVYLNDELVKGEKVEKK